jgi:hypothetical protein
LLHHFQKYFPQSLSARKLCRKILHSSPPSQAHGLFDLFFTNVTPFASFCCCLFHHGQVW